MLQTQDEVFIDAESAEEEIIGVGYNDEIMVDSRITARSCSAFQWSMEAENTAVSPVFYFCIKCREVSILIGDTITLFCRK
jgi:hypothetical protein